MGLPENYFSKDGIGTLAGASALVFVITSAVTKAAPRLDPRFVAVPLSLALGLGPALTTAKDWLDYVIGFANGCLVFLTANGGNQTAVAAVQTRQDKQGKSGEREFKAERPKNPWFKPWL